MLEWQRLEILGVVLLLSNHSITYAVKLPLLELIQK